MQSLLAVVGKLSHLSYKCVIYVQMISVFLLWLSVMWVLVVGNGAAIDMGCVASLSEGLCPS